LEDLPLNTKHFVCRACYNRGEWMDGGGASFLFCVKAWKTAYDFYGKIINEALFCCPKSRLNACLGR